MGSACGARSGVHSRGPRAGIRLGVCSGCPPGVGSGGPFGCAIQGSARAAGASRPVSERTFGLPPKLLRLLPPASHSLQNLPNTEPPEHSKHPERSERPEHPRPAGLAQAAAKRLYITQYISSVAKWESQGERLRCPLLLALSPPYPIDPSYRPPRLRLPLPSDRFSQPMFALPFFYPRGKKPGTTPRAGEY